VEGGAEQAIQPRDHERIAFPHIFQASCKAWALVRGVAVFLLEDLLTVLELVPLHVEALPH
jgi:hypothetical protein